jgi:hypothetical protein
MMHPIETLTFDLLQGKCPTAIQIQNLCYALHHAMVEANVPEMLWLHVSFEDMGDHMHKAIKNSEGDE